MNAIMQRMDWDDLRFFLEVARNGSIRGAAKDLGVNQSTVSRRIDGFEKKLDVRLFERLPSGYVMTSAGEDMLDSAQRMEEEVAALDRRVFGRDAQLQGNLRITMPEVLVTHFLIPELHGFSERYPGISLEIAASSETLNLSKREADVAIRVTNSPPEQAVGRKLLTLAKAIYTSRDYLARHDDHSTMQWIGWDDGARGPQCHRTSQYSNIPVRHQIDNLAIHFEAAKAGMGLSMLPCFMADPEPRLERMPPGDSMIGMDIWILTHQDLRNTARVRAFMEYMMEVFERHRGLFEGRGAGR